MSTEAETTSSSSNHHVKFNIEEEELKSHHENLEIVQQSAHVFHINLGYLKVDHNYKITFSLNLPKTNGLTYLTERSSKHVLIKECKQETDSLYTFTVIFNAFKEKNDLETVYFANGADHHSNIVLHFEAKVLGQHQGTPLLRNGITLLHNHSHSLSSERSHFNIN